MVNFLFEDKEQDLDLPTLRVTDFDGEQHGSNETLTVNSGKQHVTSAMSKISGVKKLNHSSSSQKPTPEFGIETEKQSELIKVKKKDY